MDDQSIPGHAVPAWLKHHLPRGVHTFNEALWRRQQASQLLSCTTQLVEQGFTVFDALETAQTMVAEDGQSFFPVPARQSFVQFLEESECLLPLQHSCSSIRAFPSLPCLSSGRYLPFAVAQTVARLMNALLSQVVACAHHPSGQARGSTAILPPLISNRDPAASASCDIKAGALQVLAAVPICLQSISGDLVPTSSWLLTTACAAHSGLAASESIGIPYLTSIVCAMNTIRELLQTAAARLQDPRSAKNHHRCLQAMLSCTLEGCSLQHMSQHLAKEASQPETALQWSVVIAQDPTRRPQRMHAIVPLLAPLLDAMCATEAACIERSIAAGSSDEEMLATVWQLQLVRQHLQEAAQRTPECAAESSFSLQLSRVIFLVQHIQELWAGPGAKLQSALAAAAHGVRDRFQAVLGQASAALKLHAHAPEAHLLRVAGGTMPLPADAEACGAWVDLVKVASAFSGLHMCGPDHIMLALGRARLPLGGADGPEDEATAAAQRDAACTQAAARLACSAGVREMLVGGAALCVAATLQDDTAPQATDPSTFVHTVLAQAREVATAELASAGGTDVSAAGSPAARSAVACGALPHEHLALPAGYAAQQVLSQLEALVQAPVVLGCLTAITASVADGGSGDVAPSLPLLVTALRRSTHTHPLLSSMARVFVWCHEQKQQPPANVLHAAWSFWHAAASSLHAPLPVVAPLALAAALPSRLADLLAASACPQPRHCVSMQLSAALPLCVQQLLQPSGMTMGGLPTHRAALAQALRSLLCLAAQHRRAPPPALQELARATAAAAQALSVYQQLCGATVVELTAALAHAAVALQAVPADAVRHAAARCVDAAAAARGALRCTAVDGLDACNDCLPALLQCIEAAAAYGGDLRGSQDVPPWLLAAIGSASVQLAAWRARLLLPPPGLDPATVAMERQQHIRHVARTVTKPELQAARTAQTLPLLPDQSAVIEQAEADLAAAETACEALERTRVPRPSPAQYDAVVAEAERCLTGLLATASTACASMLSHTGTAAQPSAARQALMQGYGSAQALSSWCDSMAERFPLYADQVSPFMLSVRDVQRGLAVACVALEEHLAAQQLPSVVTAAVLRSCLAFPLSSPYSSTCESPTLVESLNAAAASSAADVAAHLKQVTVGLLEQCEGVPGRAVQMLPSMLGVHQEIQAQLLMLRTCGLHCAAPGMERSVLQALHEALRKVIRLWRSGNDIREELQRREDSLFRPTNERCAGSVVVQP